MGTKGRRGIPAKALADHVGGEPGIGQLWGCDKQQGVKP
jgi:hypothetical protein